MFVKSFGVNVSISTPQFFPLKSVLHFFFSNSLTAVDLTSSFVAACADYTWTEAT